MKHTFNGFPIDGSAGSQVKYDLFAKYLMQGFGYVGTVQTSCYTTLSVIPLIGEILGLAFSIVFMVIRIVILLLWCIVYFFRIIFAKIFAKSKL